jgi:hypothetical protein
MSELVLGPRFLKASLIAEKRWRKSGFDTGRTLQFGFLSTGLSRTDMNHRHLRELLLNNLWTKCTRASPFQTYIFSHSRKQISCISHDTDSQAKTLNYHTTATHTCSHPTPA